VPSFSDYDYAYPIRSYGGTYASRYYANGQGAFPVAFVVPDIM
jgi:hypothetical protein